MKTVNEPKLSTIVCPHCRATYLAGEIYMPGELIGKPTDVVRDSFGKLLYHDYEIAQEPVLTEHFTCEYCNKPFVIEAQISFKTYEEDVEKDFSNPYVSLI